jgi:regulator of replication initiation timing
MEQTINNDKKTSATVIEEFAPRQTARQPEHTKSTETQLPSQYARPLSAKIEGSAKKSIIPLQKWQLFALVSLLIFAATICVAVWAYSYVHTANTDRTNWQSDKLVIETQLQSADSKAAELAEQLEELKTINAQLTLENAGLAAQCTLLADNLQSLKQAAEARLQKNTLTSFEQPAPAAPDENRLNAIRSGSYPYDMTKDELVVALGEPDRRYKTDSDEQLVYFGRSPGRFWFKTGPFLHAAR